MGLAHGGDVDGFEATYPDAPRPTLDLSTGISPHPYPFQLPDQHVAQRLPQSSDTEKLLKALAAYVGVSFQHCLALPGSQTAISLLPHLFPMSDIAIVSPTYKEHGASWRAAGHGVLEADFEACRVAKADIFLLTRPNNPTGQMYERHQLRILLDEQQERAGWLIVDEAFIDLTPSESLAKFVTDETRLIVLRSFGKFFGLAGLRLGLLLAPQKILEGLKGLMGPWPLSAITMHIARQAYGDQVWIDEARHKLKREGERLKALLQHSFGTPIGGTDLFQLVEHDKMQMMVATLASDGIYVRTFPEKPNWMRIGLPGNEEDWVRLEQALLKCDLNRENNDG